MNDWPKYGHKAWGVWNNLNDLKVYLDTGVKEYNEPNFFTHQKIQITKMTGSTIRRKFDLFQTCFDYKTELRENEWPKR